MKQIGILSPCGTGNLGDEATVAVLIEEIRRRYPNAEICGFTTSPADTRNRHGITAYPARNATNAGVKPAATSPPVAVVANPAQERFKAALKTHPYIYAALRSLLQSRLLLANAVKEIAFVAKSFKRLKGMDFLIIAGSGQLCDNFYGVWGFPYTLLKWSLIAKVSGTKLMFLSCGAGPIDSALSRLFIKCALRLADYRSFRDQGSRELVEKMGVGGANPVFPDLVFSSKLKADSPGADRSRIIAINAFPHYDCRYWPVSSPDVYSSYVKRLASFAAWLIKHNYKVLLFPTQLRADPLVIDDVKRILMADTTLNLDKNLVVKATATFDDLIAQLSVADIVVGSRFHGVLLSFLVNKPVLALSHHPKVDNLMRDMGQSEYLLNIDTFDLQTAAERLMLLESKLEVAKREIRSNVQAYQGMLDSQYAQIFQS